MVPIILAGGGGERLWPLSRPSMPKQYLDPLARGQTLLQHTLSRAGTLSDQTALIVCPLSQRFVVAQQLSEHGGNARILLEPSKQGTAIAAGLAAMEAVSADPDAICLLMPSDHHMVNDANFRQCLERAEAYARRGEIAVLGVPAQSPSTQFGYILGVEEQADSAIAAFHEKPSSGQARNYCQISGYCWNTGIVVVRADVLLSELNQYQPDRHEFLSELWKTRHIDADFVRFAAGPAKDIGSVSLDRAVLERTRKGRLVRWCDSGWADLGSWESLFTHAPHDKRGNATLCGNVLYRADSANNNVYSDTNRPVALAGVDGLLVADTDHGLLVMDKRLSETEAFHRLVAELNLRPLAGQTDQDRDD